MENNFTFEDIVNQTLKSIKRGSVVTGTVVDINKKGEIFVDIGYKADGVIPKTEFLGDEELKIGDKVKAQVVKMNDGEGNVLLSNKKLMVKQIKEEFKNKVENDNIFEEKVSSVNSNGLIVLYKNVVRIFIPISLSNIHRDEENLEDFIGKTVKFKIIENDEKRVIGSIKALIEEEKKEKEDSFWNQIEVGKKYKGTVTSLSNYGAFVDVGGAQGLLHISEMTWGRNENPRDILKVNEQIDVTVKELDKENRRFKLSYDKKGPDPWKKVATKYNVGDIVKAKITHLVPFGAFAELEKGVEGLVHISQICEKKITKPEEELKINQKVNAKIINIDLENKKIELSIRELEGTSNEYKE